MKSIKLLGSYVCHVCAYIQSEYKKCKQCGNTTFIKPWSVKVKPKTDREPAHVYMVGHDVECKDLRKKAIK